MKTYTLIITFSAFSMKVIIEIKINFLFVCRSKISCKEFSQISAILMRKYCAVYTKKKLKICNSPNRCKKKTCTSLYRVFSKNAGNLQIQSKIWKVLDDTIDDISDSYMIQIALTIHVS